MPRIGQDALRDSAEGHRQLSHEHPHTGQKDHQIHGEFSGGMEDIQGEGGTRAQAGIHGHHSLLADQADQHAEVEQHYQEGGNVHIVEDSQPAGEFHVLELLDLFALLFGLFLQIAAIFIANAVADHLGVAHAHVGAVRQILGGFHSQVGKHAPLDGEECANCQNTGKVIHQRIHDQQDRHHIDGLSGQDMRLDNQRAALGIPLGPDQQAGDDKAGGHSGHLQTGGTAKALQDRGQRGSAQGVVVHQDVHTQNLPHTHHNRLEGAEQSAGTRLIYDITDVALQCAHNGVQKGPPAKHLPNENQDHHHHGGPVKEIVPDPTQN